MSTITDIAAMLVELAADMPNHKATRSAFWDNTTAWYVDGLPNSILAHAVLKVDGIDLDADNFTSLEVNVGMPSENLPRWGVDVSEVWAAWFDSIARGEHLGMTWGEALATAGAVPVEVPATDGVYADVPEEVYHGDPGSISSSQARTILKPGGPALLRYAPRKQKADWDYGHVAHELILGKGQGIDVIDAPDWRTKAAKERRDKAYATGRVPVLRKDYRRAEGLRDAVLDHELAAILFETGTPEQSIYAHDPKTGVRLRCRPDWHTGSTFVDLKTTNDAAKFEKSIAEYGYHQQAAFYLDVAALAGIPVDSFFFVAVEKEKPYLTTVVELDAADVDLGRRLNRAAIDLYHHCHQANVWPGLPAEVRTVSLPSWAQSAADEALARAHNTIGVPA
ncbi:Cas4 family exonuclease [Gordonia phage Gudmit]|nr:Cas4 family exonuclease [Gordonia phage Gudmit]